jgi:hypothetical protein
MERRSEGLSGTKLLALVLGVELIVSSVMLDIHAIIARLKEDNALLRRGKNASVPIRML